MILFACWPCLLEELQPSSAAHSRARLKSRPIHLREGKARSLKSPCRMRSKAACLLSFDENLEPGGNSKDLRSRELCVRLVDPANRVKPLQPVVGYVVTLSHGFVTDWRRAPPLHEIIKSGLSTGAGIAAELRSDPKRQHQMPL